jgi:drug/metabolite transporter (DMT)-like permease
VALLLALAFGAWLIFAAAAEPLATAPQPGAGNVLALVSGATWALSLLGLRWIARRGIESGEEPLTVIVAGCLIAAVASAPSAFPLPESTAVDWAIVLYLGAFQIGLAYLFVTRGMRHVSALEASLLLLIEPVLSPLWAWLLLDETPSALALVGGAVIIAATAINTALRGKARRASRAAVG